MTTTLTYQGTRKRFPYHKT